MVFYTEARNVERVTINNLGMYGEKITQEM